MRRRSQKDRYKNFKEHWKESMSKYFGGYSLREVLDLLEDVNDEESYFLNVLKRCIGGKMAKTDTKKQLVLTWMYDGYRSIYEILEERKIDVMEWYDVENCVYYIQYSKIHWCENETKNTK